jgi:hypothetical protein
MTIYPQNPEEGSKIIARFIAYNQNNLSKDPKILENENYTYYTHSEYA